MANFVSAGRNNLQWPTSSWSGKGLKILDTVRELLIFLVVHLANIVRKIDVKTICIAIPWIKNHEHYTSVTGWPRLGEAQLSRSTSGPTALPLSQNSSNEWVLSGGISPHIVYILITPPYTGWFFDWSTLKMTKYEEKLKYLNWSANCSLRKVLSVNPQ